MEIPVPFASALEGDSRLDATVRLTLHTYSEWLDLKSLVFFDEYTDHGPSHVQAVMRSAAGLIAPEAWRTSSWTAPVGSAARTADLDAPFNARDAATLILAVVLHDSAMHLTKSGFVQLIDRARPWTPPDSEFITDPEPPWPDLWDGFLHQCSHYEEQQLISMFGSPSRVTRPSADPDEWTGLHVRWVGEFLRRHHARLAHEIAIAGVPGATGQLALPAFPEPWIADLAGLVARSHNMDLRAAVELLPPADRQEFRGVHTPFLMTLLRLADYLDMDAPRAPGVLLQVRSIRSPISQSEWKKHKATVHVKMDEADPESLRIDARPEDLQTFLGLRSLYAGIQEELDRCWAVLGEIYRSNPSYGLRIRRVRSSLDDPAKLRVGFVPMEARFRTAGAPLLRRLVGPLYDEHAAYGIRELVQNAVDACRELADLRQHGAVPKGLAPETDADVVVDVEEEADGCGWVTITDRGIGMTPETVRDYFLVAGASFRDSDAWRESHTSGDGTSRVARAGRFGIGALAAFLLGDTLDVETRHAMQPENRGVVFSCRIDAPLIEMKWALPPAYRRLPHGTRIRIRVTRSKVFDQLAGAESWDWYRLGNPSLKRTMLLSRAPGPSRRPLTRGTPEHPAQEVPLGTRTVLRSMEMLPDPTDALPPSWRRLPASDAETDVAWTFAVHYPVGPDDACNGLVLRRPDAWRSGFDRLWPRERTEAELYLYRPRLSIVDKGSRTVTDLRRTTLLDVPFERELTEAVCREVLALLISRTAPSRQEVFQQLCGSFPGGRNESAAQALPSLYHPAVSSRIDEHRTQPPGSSAVSWLVLTAKGLMPAAAVGADIRAFVVARLNPGSFPLESGRRLPPMGHVFDIIPDDMCVQAVSGDPVSFFASRTRALPGSLLIPSASWFTDILQHRPDVQHTDAGNGWVFAWTGGPPPSILERLVLAEADAADASVVFLLQPERRPHWANPLTALWLDLLGVPAIPFDLTERRRALHRAFQELSPEIERLEHEQGKPWSQPEIT